MRHIAKQIGVGLFLTGSMVLGVAQAQTTLPNSMNSTIVFNEEGNSSLTKLSLEVVPSNQHEFSILKKTDNEQVFTRYNSTIQVTETNNKVFLTQELNILNVELLCLGQPHIAPEQVAMPNNCILQRNVYGFEPYILELEKPKDGNALFEQKVEYDMNFPHLPSKIVFDYKFHDLTK